MTAWETRKLGAEKLATLEYPELESLVLVCCILSVTKEQFFANTDLQLTESQTAEFLNLVEQRLKGIPCAYLTGKKEFFDREFTVNSSVLIPRPDTETAVETALSLIQKHNISTVLDLCTGSGCIAITIDLEKPGLHIDASDISKDALAIANLNKKKLGSNVLFIQSDLFTNISKSYDMIISNPPYLTTSEVNQKEEEGLYEPKLALVSGKNGLQCINRILDDSMDYLTPNGYLLLEAADPQCPKIASAMKEAGFTGIQIIRDLGGRQRVVMGMAHGNKA